MIVMDGEEFLTAQEACETLAIKPATLYAYVSRGVLGSYRQGIKRTRLYRRAEVERLMRLRRPESADEPITSEPTEPSDSHADGSQPWIPYV
ncbi:MAG TPA: helix-turn-helix domain-containing protein [Ktedonobacterales bacterium]